MTAATGPSQAGTEAGRNPVELWAAADPGRAAIVSDAATLTYGELDDHADRLAEALVRRGVRRGDFVVVRMRMRPEWFVVNRALGKLGCVQVALNYSLTPAECAALLTGIEPVAMVCDDTDPAPLRAACAHNRIAVFLHVADVEQGEWADCLGTERTVRSGPDHTAMAIFTSGTTGQPKAVSHLDRVAWDEDERAEYFAALAATPPRPPGSTVLLTLPLHHAAGPFEANISLLGGGRVILLPRFDAERALEIIEEHRVTHWMAVPTMLLRVRAVLERDARQYDTGSLRTLYVGAAPVPQDLKVWVSACIGPGVLWEQYGSTEASGITFLRPQDQLSRPYSSGRPFPHVDVKVLDELGAPVADGLVGEIAVRTPGMVGQYLGRDGAPTLKDGYYRTGDAGYLDADGFLFLTGRRKDMVVVGGVNVYPAEIEAALVEHPGILDCAVFGIPDDDLGEVVAAFVEVAVKGSVPTAAELAEHLASRLARYKHPRLVRVVDGLPRNSIGKVLKTELRDPFWKGRNRAI